MSNNKQSSVEWLFQNMFEISQTLVIGGDTQYELMKKAFEQAKAMHKEEIINSMSIAFIDGAKIGAINYQSPYKDWEHYYNETFGGNNE